MQLLHVSYVPIAQMKLPGNWRQVLDDPSIPGRAMSLKLVGQLHEPMVRKHDWLLVHGSRRVAAHMHNGDTEVLCKVIEASDQEVELIRKIENAHREHLSREELREMVDAISKMLVQFEPEGCKPPPTKMSMKLPKTKAREIVADALGITPDAVKKRLAREKHRKMKVREQAAHDDDLGIRSPWATLDPEYRSDTNRVVGGTNCAIQLLQKAQQQLTRMYEAKLPLHELPLNSAREAIAEVARVLRGLLPSCLCPFCKGVEDLQKKCHGCRMTGYITKAQEPGVPEELLREGDEALVSDGGKYVPLKEYYESAA